jgi:hypothetical protein
MGCRRDFAFTSRHECGAMLIIIQIYAFHQEVPDIHASNIRYFLFQQVPPTQTPASPTLAKTLVCVSNLGLEGSCVSVLGLSGMGTGVRIVSFTI